MAGSFGYFGIVSEQQRRLLLENTRRDALTGLYTRGAFFELAEKLFAGRNAPFSVLMIDLDNFKKINDTYGHIVGDAVIRQAAEVILKSIRDGDIAGRYGGEEICVFLPKCGSNAARIIAERIVFGVAEQFVYLPNGQSIACTTSLGYSTSEINGYRTSELPRLEDLISNADAALYSAKNLGKNQFQAAL